MNERYLFRGKHGKDWLIGTLSHLKLEESEFAQELTVSQDDWHIFPIKGDPEMACNSVDNYIVDPATIGQCTGFRDKNGTLVFEGDIVEIKLYDNVVKKVIIRGLAPVIWDAMYAYPENPPTGFGMIWSDRNEFNRFDGFYHQVCTFEVVENIHDNPAYWKGAYRSE